MWVVFYKFLFWEISKCSSITAQLVSKTFIQPTNFTILKSNVHLSLEIRHDFPNYQELVQLIDTVTAAEYYDGHILIIENGILITLLKRSLNSYRRRKFFHHKLSLRLRYGMGSILHYKNVTTSIFISRHWTILHTFENSLAARHSAF